MCVCVCVLRIIIKEEEANIVIFDFSLFVCTNTQFNVYVPLLSVWVTINRTKPNQHSRTNQSSFLEFQIMVAFCKHLYHTHTHTRFLIFRSFRSIMAIVCVRCIGCMWLAVLKGTLRRIANTNCEIRQSIWLDSCIGLSHIQYSFVRKCQYMFVIYRVHDYRWLGYTEWDRQRGTEREREGEKQRAFKPTLGTNTVSSEKWTPNRMTIDIWICQLNITDTLSVIVYWLLSLAQRRSIEIENPTG